MTSRSSERRWLATSSASARLEPSLRAVPAISERSSAIARVIRPVSSARCSARPHSAASRPASCPLAGPSGSSSARSASRLSVSASNGLSRSQPSSKRRSAHARSLSCGARRDRGAERAQLVLLLAGHDEHPVRSSARAERERAPRAGSDARPCQRAKRHAAVAEQPQRREQVAHHRAPVAQRLLHVVELDRVARRSGGRARPRRGAGAEASSGTSSSASRCAMRRPLVNCSSAEAIATPCSVATRLTSPALASVEFCRRSSANCTRSARSSKSVCSSNTSSSSA